MVFLKRMSLLIVACSIMGARQLPEDPVMKARNLRAKAQGISEADLPPVPRGVTEPPPLPPPELHLKDSRQGRLAKVQGKKATKGAKTAKGKTSAKHAEQPVKTARKSGKHKKVKG